MFAEAMNASASVIEATAEDQQCQPAPRAIALQRQATRYLEDHIADEEQRCRETERCLGNVQVREHLQLGEADVLAVDEGDQKHQDQHRHQAPAQPTHQGLFVFRTVHAANCPVRLPAMRLVPRECRQWGCDKGILRFNRGRFDQCPQGIVVNAVSTTPLFREDRGSRQFFACRDADSCGAARAQPADPRTGRSARCHAASAQRARGEPDGRRRSAVSRGDLDPAPARSVADRGSLRQRRSGRCRQRGAGVVDGADPDRSAARAGQDDLAQGQSQNIR